MASDMVREIINRVEVLDSGELLLGLESQGEAWYQYVYREAAGVYWDESRHGFKSTPMKDWPCSKWFLQIVGVVHQGLGIELHLGKNITWHNVPDQDKAEIGLKRAI